MFGILILFLIFLYITNNPSYCCQKNNNIYHPLDILKKRYIDGEIDEEEYLTKKKILKK